MNLNDTPFAIPPGMRNVPLEQRRGAACHATADWVAEERPVALEYNGISHAVMLATPADLEDFALGFSLTEGLVETPAQVHDIEVVEDSRGVTVQLRIASSCMAALKDRRRSLAGRTGCGLCGTESLDHAVRAVQPVQSTAALDPGAVRAAIDALRSRQPLHEATGAVHAAAFADATGSLLLVREDVGRHNALDKLVGAMAQSVAMAATGFIVVTSRASYEMVGKASRAGVPLLAAISGVTALAIETAVAADLCLIGFARGERLNVYSNAARLRAVTHDGC